MDDSKPLLPRELANRAVSRVIHGTALLPNLDQTHVRESHAEIEYDGVRVPEEALLGAENAGFQIAQQRLGPYD